jgi:sulfite exporter TauE/SafE
MTGLGADPTLLAAFVAGLVGSSHCLGMCGGIAAALGMGTAGRDAGAGRALGRALLYNGGRIASYAVAGTLAGGIGFILGQALHAPAAILVMRVLTGAVLMAIGLQVAFNLRLLRPLETVGMHAWRRVAPLATRLMGNRSAGGTILLGALWGWMPCGLVYGMLVAAAATGGPGTGAALMAVFGLGTAPAMVATGALASRFQRLHRNPAFRRGAGLLVVALGAWTAFAPFGMQLLHGAAG